MTHRLLALCLLFVAWGSPVRAQDLVIRFLDVGQGDAILIENAGRFALIDAGPSDDVVTRLRALGVDSVALLVASHNHSDHIGGADAVLRSLRVQNYMDNGHPATTQIQRQVLKLVRDRNVRYLSATERSITLGDATLRIIPSPADPPDAGEQNNRSIVVLLERGTFRALFSGDSEQEEIQQLLTARRIPDVDVLKAAHHGSSNGVSAAWLRAARPELVAISLGADNTYGHPHARALAAYRNARARIMRTDQDGEIVVRVDRAGRYLVSTEQTRPANPIPRRRRTTRPVHN